MNHKALVVIDIQNDITRHYRDIMDKLNAESRRDEWNRLKPFFDLVMAEDAENIIIVSHGDLLSVFNSMFGLLYLTAGISDMVDGMVARRTNTTTGFGARLDTAADFVFVVICLFRLFPVMDIPIWLYVWTSVIALIKSINIVSGVVKRKRFVAVHSVMNKAAGGLLFALPLTVPLIELKYTAFAVCAVATFAAIQEGHLIRTGDERSDEV